MPRRPLDRRQSNSPDHWSPLTSVLIIISDGLEELEDLKGFLSIQIQDLQGLEDAH